MEVQTQAGTTLDPNVEPVPAGSVPIGEDNTQPVQDPAPEPTATDPNVEPPVDDGIPEKFKGKDAKDIAAAYVQLEEKLGQQGAEVGQLRSQVEQLNGMIAQTQQAQQEPGANPEFDQQIADISSKAENGDLSYGEAMQQIAAISAKQGAEQGARLASEQYQQAQQDLEQRTTYERFVEKNPDFPELVQSGELDKVKGPEDDNLSAYYKFKAMQAQQEVEKAAKEAYEKGKREVQGLKDGTNVTSKVLSKPGTEIRNQNTPQKPLSGPELENDLLSALKDVRGG